MTPLFEMVLLDSRHDRTVFDYGAELLNRYFSQQISQDVRRNDSRRLWRGFYKEGRLPLPKRF